MSTDYLLELNQEQHIAVTHENGPLLLLAGAGSGKTKALTCRAAYLIEKKRHLPHQVLLLTFTNKAANEMQHRLRSLIGMQLPFAGTFHSFCAKILRQYGPAIGLSAHYAIYDTTDQQDLIKNIIKELNLPKEFRPTGVLSQIGTAKHELLSPKQYQDLARGYFQQQVAIVYEKYQQRLERNQALDFDDLLIKTVQLLTQSQETKQKLQHQFKHVLIDEYQDTNKAQYLIAKTISMVHQNLTVVGDASQSIYRWRGADYRNLEYLQQDFPDITTVKLERNYRSTQAILDAAYAVISHNKSHPILSLWTNETKGEKLSLYQANDEVDEAGYIIRSLKTTPITYTSAVLYRTNAQSRPLEEACIRAGIPYVLVGGIKFYERKEVKDMLSYMRLLINPNDEVSLARALKTGKRRLERLLVSAQKWDLVNTITVELFDQILTVSGYMDKFDLHSESDLERVENIKELRSVATQFDQLDEFLTNVALVEDASQVRKGVQTDFPVDETTRPLVLMTIHASKGLEFDQVFLIGLEEGVFPHSRALLDPAELEEERRLCYVALTRARKKLHLIYALYRSFYGGRQAGIVSRFISEIPQHLIASQAMRITSHPYLPRTSRSSEEDDLLEKLVNDEIDIDEFLN